jgi:hypothetical protein
VIWEPFVLALVLGLIVSAGLYFAYLWPSIEPVDPDDAAAGPPAQDPQEASPRSDDPGQAGDQAASPAP